MASDRRPTTTLSQPPSTSSGDPLLRTVELNSRFKRVSADGGDVTALHRDLTAACDEVFGAMARMHPEQRQFVRAFLRMHDLRDSLRVLRAVRAIRNVASAAGEHPRLPDPTPFLEPWDAALRT